MDKYAIVQIGGKQFKITEGQSLSIERQSSLKFDVLAYSDGGKLILGDPFVEGIKIDATLKDAGLGKKVHVLRFKAKSRYRKNKGHRQPMSLVEIKSLSLAKSEPVAKKRGRPKKVN